MILVPFLLTAALAATIPIPPDADFKPYHEQDGVKIERVERADAQPWIRAPGELAAAPEAIAKVIAAFDTYQELLSGMVEKVKVLESGPGYARLHMTYHFPFPLSNRDTVVGYHFEKQENGKFRVWWSREEKAGDPSEGVRIQDVQGETRVESAGKGSRVVYTYVGDLGADLNLGTKERAWKKEPVHYFDCLRKALKLPPG